MVKLEDRICSNAFRVFVLILVVGLFSGVRAEHRLSTQEGLTLEMDDRTGAVQASLKGKSLAPADVSGGFFVYDYDGDKSRKAQASKVSVIGKENGLEQTIYFAKNDLKLNADFTSAGNHIAVEGVLQDLSKSKARAVDLVFRIPFAPDSGVFWWKNIARAVPILVEKQSSRSQPGRSARSSGDFSMKGQMAHVDDAAVSADSRFYPLASVTNGRQNAGLAIALDPESPIFFEMEYDSQERCLSVIFRLGLSALPQEPKLKSQVPFRFVIYSADGHWGFRDAVRKWYTIYPETFERDEVQMEGLWMLGQTDHEIAQVSNPGLYAYRQHGQYNAPLHQLYGISVFPYILVGQRDFRCEAQDVEGALKELEDMDPELPWFWYRMRNPGLKEMIETSSLRAPESESRHSLDTGDVTAFIRERSRNRRFGTFPVNPNPNLYADSDRNTVGKNTLEYVSRVFRNYPYVTGIYVDSLGRWGTYENIRHDHFKYISLPLIHRKGEVMIHNALSHVEFLRGLRDRMPENKLIFGNGISFGREWATFACDVLGREIIPRRYKNRVNFTFFRAIARHKPVMTLCYFGGSAPPRAEMEEYVQSSIAYGIGPSLSGKYNKIPSEHLDLYKKFGSSE